MRLAFAFSFLVSTSAFAALPSADLEYYQNLKSTAFSKSLGVGDRWTAVQEMARADFSWFQKDLERALKDDEWFIRNAALVAIQNGKPEFVRQWSEKLLFDKALVVRTQAAKNLIRFGDSSSSDELLKALNHKMNFRGEYSLWIRPYIAQALALNPPSNWKHVFQSMLTDRDEKVQSWAIMGLEKKSGLRLGSNDDSLSVKKQRWLNFFGIRRI